LHAVTNAPQQSTGNGSANLAITAATWADTQFWQVIDPEVARENPVEDKHRRLVRSHRTSPYDRELKPNAKDRDELSVRIHLLCSVLTDPTFLEAHPQLRTITAAHLRGEGPHMEIPLLPHAR
jgi:hypothetical protein